MKGNGSVATPLFNDWVTRKLLADLGVRINLDDLDAFEVEYLTFISSEFARLEHAEAKKAKSKSRRR